MNYQDENRAKTSFNGVYSERTPHNYLAEMARHGYQIGQQTAP